MSPQPGEVGLADLGLAAKSRPVVVVSRLDPDPPRALARAGGAGSAVYQFYTGGHRMSDAARALSLHRWSRFKTREERRAQLGKVGRKRKYPPCPRYKNHSHRFGKTNRCACGYQRNEVQS